MSEIQNTPRLRFPEFHDVWRLKTLGDLGKIINGITYNPSQIQEDGVLVLRSSNIQNGRLSFEDNVYIYIEKYNPVKKNDILICVRNGSQRLIGKNALIYKNFDNMGFGAFMTVYRSERNPFLFQWFDTEKYYKEIHKNLGATINSINGSDLKKFKVPLPSLPEQQKIADFLTAVDKRIELLEKKKTLLETYKKGVMKKIFNQEIRFKDENGKDFPDWEEKRLGILLKHISSRNKSLNVELVLSVSNTLGFISQKEQFDKHRVASKDVSNYKIVRKNQFGYNPSRINVGSIALLKDYEVGIVSPMYVIFQTKEKLDSTYMEYLTQTHLFRHYVKVGCSGSVRDSLNFDEMEKFKFNIPSLNEQIKISEFLISIDNQLELLETQIDKSKTWKKGLLQKMFV